MTKLTPTESRALMRLDPGAFLNRVFLHLNPGQAFLPNWHLDLILAVLERSSVGTLRRLIINAPPRSLKSICASVAYVAWLLGHNPTLRILCISHSQALADKHARDCLSVISSDWYRILFPQMQLAERRPAIANFTTTLNGCRMATSVGGTITGLGADVIILDNLLKADQAMSETERNGLNAWFGDTVYSRLDNKRTGRIIVVGHRLHVDDLPGHLQRQTHEKWETLSFPAIAEVAQSYSWETPFGKFTHRRAVGDVLHPERESLEQLKVVKETLGTATFAAQYQQNPNPAGAVTIKDSYFRRYRDFELPQQFDRVIQSWDTANKPGDSSSYSCCTTWGQKGNQYHLIDVWRERVAYQDLKNAVKDLRDRYRPNVILIEDRASGIPLIQELRAAGIDRIEPCISSNSKTARFAAQIPLIESGQIFLPEQAVWLVDYLGELKAFPNAPHTDQQDSTAQALAWLKGHPPPLAWIAQWNEYERLKQESDTVLMRAPPGWTTYHDIKGREYCLGPDRLVQVDKMSVAFLPPGWNRA